MVFSEQDIANLKARFGNWEAMKTATDPRAAQYEAELIFTNLGPRLLPLIEGYIRLQEEKEATLAMLNKINDALKEGTESDGQT